MVDFKKELFANAYKKRIPLTATIEIISQCNFRCVHCYVDDMCRKDMLTYEEIVDFGNQIIQMGCLYVVLTGGEVLLHPDFEKIYLFFIKKGVCVSVFTNGSLINRSIVDLFIKYPPRVVEITMYGFKVETYTLVTKSNAYDMVKKNVLLLKQYEINVLLKMFVVKENYNDFDEIFRFSVENNIPYKFDTVIIGEKDGPEMRHQIKEEKVLSLDQGGTSTTAKYNDETYQYIMGTRDNKLFLCGAGRSSCWLKSNNYLRICNFLSDVEYDLKKHKVQEAWTMMEAAIERSLSEDSDCYSCSYRPYCDYCPAKASSFFGDIDMKVCSDIYCKVAKSRVCSLKKRG